MQIAISESTPRVGRRGPDIPFHVALLTLSAGVVFLSCVMTIVGERQVLIPVVKIPLPGICTYQRFFGVGCPGCGLTRSFISIGHGDLSAAWRFNPAGLLGFVLVAAQIPYRAAQLLRLQRGKAELRFGWLGQAVFWAFFALLMIQWTVRTFFGG